MQCGTCGYANAAAARFCGSCGARVAVTCPRCDAAVAIGLRFCTACGAPAPDAADAPVGQVEPPPAVAERRRVSILFLDLEGFTSLAESLDAEEVRAIQARYFETARELIARYGGTVEKFIGDAVMAVWGAPAAHEDDAARAVLAALGLVNAVGRLGGAAARHRLTGRAAVATGEAAVTVDAVGQGLVSGDLVNVASRLQGHAPSGGVLVGATTRSLAPDAATYSPVGEVELKGRTAPLTAFVATARPAVSHARPTSHSGPFVGRDRELRELVGLFDAVARDGVCRLVTISGIAGIGKSRLAWELREHLDARTGLVAWHAGRAPAYGEEVTFAAVAEMVRHRVRAAPNAQPEVVRRQLASALVELVRDDTERSWLEPRLTVLLDPSHGPRFERDDLFAAWRRFFERVASAGPAVLLFEDLQWADPGLLDFIEHLASWARDRPILVVALTRPELIDRRPGFGSSARHTTTIHLPGLSDEAMRELLALRAPDVDGRFVEEILARAGGVPLYAVEVARVLADAPPDRKPSMAPDMPDSLRGLVAARIDALPRDERRLLLAASVLGRRFRIDELVSVGAHAGTVRDRVDALVRRELLTRDDGLAGGSELGFVQDLVREVAYATLSRAERRALHLAAAKAVEAGTDETNGDAERLAGHLIRAHDLAPGHADATRIARRAVSALRRAAAAARDQHVAAVALGHLEQALRLTDDEGQRVVVLGEVATAASEAGRLDLAEQYLRELVSAHRDADRRREMLHARARLASVLLTAQRNAEAVAELEVALRAIRNLRHDPAAIELSAQLARARLLIGDPASALSWAERALQGARAQGMDAAAADLLVTRATARVTLGETDAGLADLRSAIDAAVAANSVGTELRARNNLAWLLVVDDPHATLAAAREAVDVAVRMGVGDMAAQLAEVACAAALETGDWDWLLTTADDLVASPAPLANRLSLAATAGIARALRGDSDPLSVLADFDPLPRDLDEQVAAGVAYARAWQAFLSGNLERAGELASEAADASLGVERLHALALATRVALWGGHPDEAHRRLEELSTVGVNGRVASAVTTTLRAGLAAAREGAAGDGYAYDTASQAWRQLDLPLHLALCLADERRLAQRADGDELHRLLERTGAQGLRAAVGLSGSAGPPRPARSRRPTAGTARRSDAGRRRPPATDRRPPAG